MTEVSYKVARNVALDFPLPSLEIRHFRAFQHLRIDRLGRVNLIVGKNNVGKTCILEALQVYARNGAPDVLWSILSGRDELRPDEVRRERELTRRQPELFPAADLLDDDLAAIGSLFYGRPDMAAESHPNMWRLIFQMARRLNVQVFATTHSWDCIEAFQEAAQEDEFAGMLIRLQDRDGQITPTLFDERELSIVTRRQLEVR